jgi:hypothetical protein
MAIHEAALAAVEPKNAARVIATRGATLEEFDA